MKIKLIVLLMLLPVILPAQEAKYRTNGPAVLNDLSVTPGLANPDITQANIRQTICDRKNWKTGTIRPSVSYTDKLKLVQMKQYGDTVHQTKESLINPKEHKLDTNRCIPKSDQPACYELDHLESLQLGGHPSDEKNLWPEPYRGDYGARKKDVVEGTLWRMVCSDKITLGEAQACISQDWYQCAKDKRIF